jgi:predicted secreted protein
LAWSFFDSAHNEFRILDVVSPGEGEFAGAFVVTPLELAEPVAEFGAG